MGISLSLLFSSQKASFVLPHIKYCIYFVNQFRAKEFSNSTAESYCHYKIILSFSKGGQMRFKRSCCEVQKTMFRGAKGHVLKVKRWSFEKDYDYDWKRYTQLILYLLIHYTLFLPSY